MGQSCDKLTDTPDYDGYLYGKIIVKYNLWTFGKYTSSGILSTSFKNTQYTLCTPKSMAKLTAMKDYSNACKQLQVHILELRYASLIDQREHNIHYKTEKQIS